MKADLIAAEPASILTSVQCAESALPACLKAHANEAAVGEIKIHDTMIALTGSGALTDPGFQAAKFLFRLDRIDM